MIPPDREVRLRTLLIEWDSATAKGRSVELEDFCKDDPDLLPDLRARIELELEEKSFWTANTGGRSIRPSDPPPVDPSALARYSKLQRIGEGGTGVVFRAFDEQLQRWIALKFLSDASSAPDDPRVRGFRHEAAVTARLEHPGIVPIHAVGIDRLGRPFYAMKFVSERTLHDEIRRVHGEATRPARVPFDQTLEFRSLLDLFRKVCDAVAFAHAKDVVHCDLKPRNVMIGEYGEALVVDWGSARDLSRPSESPPMRHGTLGYMSPEYQSARFGEVGPASDVFSLGATLHQILTGQPAFRGEAGAVFAAVEAGRLAGPIDRDPRVPRALDAICRKALATATSDRYATARELSEDLQRWLAGQPTLAWPEPASVRLRRWADRHRPRVAAALAVVFVAAVSLPFVVAFQIDARRRIAESRDRAESRLALARDAVDRFRDIVENHHELRSNAPLSRELMGEPLAFYRKMRLDLMSDPPASRANLESLADADHGLGLLESKIGSQAAAIEYLREAVAILEGLLGEHPDAEATRFRLAQSIAQVGFVEMKMGKVEEAVAKLRRSRQLLEGESVRKPWPLKARRFLAHLRYSEGTALYSARRNPEALSIWEESRAMLEGLQAEAPSDPSVLDQLASVHESIGLLRSNSTQRSEAKRQLDEALRLRTRLLESAPDDPLYLSNLATLHYNRGNLFLFPGLPDCWPEYARAAEVLEKLSSRHGLTTLDQETLASSYGNMANVRRNRGDRSGAMREFRRVHALFSKLVEENPNDVVRRSRLAITLHNLAELSHEDAEKASLLREAIDHQSRVVAAYPRSPIYRDCLNLHYIDIGEALLGLGREDEAAELIGRRLDLWPNVASEYRRAAVEYARCAAAAAGKHPSRAASVEAHAGKALAMLRTSVDLGLKDLASLTASDFDFIKDRPEYRRIVLGAMDRAFPADPFR